MFANIIDFNYRLLKIFKNKKIRNTTNDNKSFKKRNYWPLSKIAGRFVVWYAIAILIGMILLASPLSLTDIGKGASNSYDYKWDFLSSLFVATSAFSDTGLTVINIAANYNFFGQLVTVILIEMGGFGIITFKVMLFIFIGRKLTLKDKLLAQGERGSASLGSTIHLIKNSFIFLIVIEGVSTIALFPSFYFYQVPSSLNSSLNINAFHNFLLSLWSSIFHSISAINNAGFDIIGKDSLYPYSHLYIIQFIFMFEFIMGGIGFPTFYDLLKKFQSLYNKKFSRLTLFTKLNLITYFSVSAIGVAAVFAIEGTHHGANSLYTNSSNTFNFIMNVFFNVMSTRNAGFSTVGVNIFQPSSKLVMSWMMFIGSAPSSTAGGIRTTTLSVIILTIVAIVRNSEVLAFKRKIPDETVRRSFSVFALSLFLLIITTGVALITYDNVSSSNLTYIDIFFIFSSAFGTTGLSTLSTQQMLSLNIVSKISLIFLMLVGQIGISNVLLMFKTKSKKEYKLVEENITIG